MVKGNTPYNKGAFRVCNQQPGKDPTSYPVNVEPTDNKKPGYMMPLEPDLWGEDVPQPGEYSTPITAEQGKTNVVGLDVNGNPCDPGKVINADPSFVVQGNVAPLPIYEISRVYLSPTTSPGVQDTASFPAVFESDALASAQIIDKKGGVVRILMSNDLMSKDAPLEWDGRDSVGQPVVDGYYQLIVQGTLTGSGASSEYSGYYVVDNTAPTADITRIEGEPSEGMPLKVFGSAYDSNFNRYTLEIVGGVGQRRKISEGTTQVSNGEIASLEGDVPSGPIHLVLTVFDKAGNNSQVTRDITIAPSDDMSLTKIIIGNISSLSVPGSGVSAQDKPGAYLDDSSNVPSGATFLPVGGFMWVQGPAYSGSESHTGPCMEGHSVHYFIHAGKSLLTEPVNNDLIIQYVYMKPGVREIMIQFFTGNGDGEHRAYWGDDLIQDGGVKGTVSKVYMGALPPGTDKWIRLKIHASDLGVLGIPVRGIAFHVYADTDHSPVYWDKTTTSASGVDLLPNVQIVERGQTDDYVNYKISYSLIGGGSPGQLKHVALVIRDGNDQHMKTLVDADIPIGEPQSVDWNGTDDNGNLLPAGIYHYQFSINGQDAFDCDSFEVVGNVDYSSPITADLSLTDGAGNYWEVDDSSQYDPCIIKREGSNIVTRFGLGNLPNSMGVFRPVDLTRDGNGNIYVIDADGHRLIKLSSEMTYLGEAKLWGANPVAATIGASGGEAGHLFVRLGSGETLRVNVGRGSLNQENVIANIAIPSEESLVRAVVPIYGTASARNFSQYVLSLSRSINGEYMYDIVHSSTEQVLSPTQLMLARYVTLYGNLGTLDTGRNEYVYVPHGPNPSEEEGLNGVYTVKLAVSTSDGKTAYDRRTIIVGRLIGEAFDSKAFSADGKIELTVPSLSLAKGVQVVAFFPTRDIGRNAAFFILPGLRLISEIYEARPAGLEFLNKATLTMKYDPARLDTNGDGVKEVAPDNLAIYEWNMFAGKWLKLESALDEPSHSLRADVSRLAGTPSLYAILADTSMPVRPVIVQPPSPTLTAMTKLWIFTEPKAEITVYSDSGEGVFHRAVTVKASLQGDAIVDNVALSIGTNRIFAVAMDAGNNTSMNSAEIIVVRLPVPPPIQAEFDSADYTKVVGACCVDAGDILGIKAFMDEAYDEPFTNIRVRTSVKDPIGFDVTLNRVATGSNEYRGIIRLADMTDAANSLIAAGVDGETLEMIADSNILAAVTIHDRTAPVGPLVTSVTHPSLCQVTFEDGELGGISALTGCSVSIDSTSAPCGGRSLKVTNTDVSGPFAVSIINRPYSLGDYPIISFDYMFPIGTDSSNAIIGIWVEIDSKLRWWHINLTDENSVFIGDFGGNIYEHTAGAVPNVIADGMWHHAEVNLQEIIGNGTVTRIIFANYRQDGFMLLYPGYDNALGATYQLDNILITQAGSSSLAATFAWIPPADATGISGYGASISADPCEEAPVTINTANAERTYSETDILGIGNGTIYFHVRAIDNVGNAGLTNHYRIRVDTVGPVADNPYPTQGALAPPSELYLRVRDFADTSQLAMGSGLDLDSVVLSVNGVEFRNSDGGLTYDQNAGKLTLRMGVSQRAPPTIANGQTVQVELTSAKDKAGNQLQSAPFKWNFTASFEQFSRGQAVMLTVNGGRQPSWSPDARTIVFSRDTGTASKLFVIDATDLQEKGSTARQITFDPPGDVFADSHSAWSPAVNDSRIAFERVSGGVSSIWVVNAATNTAERQTFTEENDHHPSWDAEGEWIYFERGNNMWRVNPSSKTEELVLDDAQKLVREPFCRPDGRVLYRDALYVDNIRVFDRGNRSDNALTTENAETNPVSSPSGDHVVFVSRRSGTPPTLWAMNSDGTQPRKLLDNPGGFSDSEPACAPNGSGIAFESSRSGSPNIWIISALKQVPLTVQPPAFSPQNADGLFDTAVLSYGVNAEALLTIKVQGGGKERTFLQDVPVTAGGGSAIWDGKMPDGAGGMSYPPSGVYSFVVSARSPYGGDPVVLTGEIRLDNNRPQTTLPTAGTFIVKDGSFEVYAMDGYAGAGVKEIRIREGTNAFAKWEFTTPYSSGIYPYERRISVPLSALGATANMEGRHSIMAGAVDSVGNGVLWQSTELVIDGTKPHIDVVPNGPIFTLAKIRYAKSSVVFTIQAMDDQGPTDTNSGMYRLLVDGKAVDGYIATRQFSGEGAHSFTADATDKVGLAADHLDYSVFIDDTPPSSAVTVDAGVFNGAEWFAQASISPKLHVSALDTLSGDKYIHVELSKDDSPVDIGGADVPSLDWTLDSGTWVINWWAEDKVGNREAPKTMTIVVTSSPLPGVNLTVVGKSYTDAQNRTYVAGQGASAPSMIRLVAIDPAVTGIKYTLGTGPEQSQSVPPSNVDITLPAGGNELMFHGMRGTVPDAESAAVFYADAQSPAFGGMTLTGPNYTGPAGTFVRAADSQAALAFSDPDLPDASAGGAGIAETSYMFTGGTYSPVAGAIGFTGLPSNPDAITLSVQCTDRVGNATTITRDFRIDDLVPVTSAAIPGNSFTRPEDGRLFLNASGGSAQISLEAKDYPLDAGGNEAGSGVARILYLVDGDPNGTYTAAAGAKASLSVPGESVHTVYFKAEDNLVNRETRKSVSFTIDNTPPVTTVAGREPAYAAIAGILYLGQPYSGQPGVFLSASDGNGAGVAPDGTTYSVGGGGTQTYTPSTPITFTAEQEYQLSYRSVDRLGLIEGDKSLTLRVDRTSPAVTLGTGSGVPSVMRDDYTWIGAGAQMVATATDAEVSPGVPGSGAGEIRVTIGSSAPLVSVPSGGGGTPSRSFNFSMPTAEGAYNVKAEGKDRVQNAAVLTRKFVVDATPPTVILTAAPDYTDTGTVKYAAPTTVFTITASDPAIGAMPGSGVDKVIITVDSGNPQEFAGDTGTVTNLSVGDHSIAFRARDAAGNESQPAAVSVKVLPAGSVPTVVMAVTGARFDAGGKVYVMAAGTAAPSAITLQTVSGGAPTIAYRLDVDPALPPITAPAPSVGLGSLAAGEHHLEFFGMNGGAKEISTFVTIVADSNPPALMLTAQDTLAPQSILDDRGTPFDTSDDITFVRPSASLSIKAEDPLEGGVAGSGLVSLMAGVDSGSLATMTAPLHITQQGMHVVQAAATDNVGFKASHSWNVAVDGTPPATSVVATAAIATLDGKKWAPARTKFMLVASDGPSGGAGCGTAEIRYWRDSETDTSVYSPASPISFSGDGLKTIRYQSVDRLGNTEVIGNYQVWFDTHPPSDVVITASGPSYTDGAGRNYGAPSTAYGVTASDSGSGLGRIEVRRDSGLFEPYSLPFTLPSEGAHALAARATDRVGNQSGLVEYPVVTDGTAPVSQLFVASGPSVAESGGLRISGKTKLGLSSADPDLPGGLPGSGVREIRYSVGTQSEQAYAAAFSVAAPDGEETALVISFHGVDNVSNAESPGKIQSIVVDNKPPTVPQVTFDATSGNVILNWGVEQGAVCRVSRIVDGNPATRTVISGPNLLTGGTFTDTGASGLSFTSLTYEVVAVDDVENESAPGTAIVHPGDLAPKIEFLANGAPLADGAWFKAVPVHLQVNIAGAASQSVEVRKDGVLIGTSSAINLTADGAYSVSASATRVPFNITASRSFAIDTVKPVIVVTANGQPLVDGKHYQPFKLEYSAQDTNPGTISALLGGVDISSGISILVPGQYALALIAMDAAGNRTDESYSFSIDIPNPCLVQDLEAEAGDGIVSLSWDVISGTNAPANIRIYRAEGQGDTPTLYKTISASQSSFEDLGVENNVEYSYSLSAEDTLGFEGPKTPVQSAHPMTAGWPMFQRDALHQSSDLDLSVAPPLGERWRVQLTPNSGGLGLNGYQEGIVVSGTLFVASVGGDVRAYKAETGDLLWAVSGYPTSGTPAYHHGLLYVMGSNGLTVFKADTGEVAWSLWPGWVGTGAESSPIIYKGVLYFGSLLSPGSRFPYYVVAVDVDPSSPWYRSVIWTRSIGRTYYKTTPGAANNLVYMMDGSGSIRALNWRTGAVVWSKSLGQWLSTTESICLSVIPPAVYVTHESGLLYAFNAETGDILWSRDVQGRYSSPAVAWGNVFVAADHDNKLYAVKQADGTYAWTADTFQYTGTTTDITHGSPMVADGRVHLYATNGQVFTVDALTGTLLDTLQLDNFVPALSRITGGGSNLFVPSADGQLIALTSVAYPPSSFEASRSLDGVLLEWSLAVPNGYAIAGYRIYRSTGADIKGDVLAEVPDATMTYTDTTASTGQTWYYRVAAFDDRGVEGRSAGPVWVRMIDLAVTTAWPPNNQAIYADCSGWTFSPTGTVGGLDFARYSIVLVSASGTEVVGSSSSPVSSGALLPVTVPSCGDYIVRVVVEDNYGDSAQSEIHLSVLSGSTLLANIFTFSTKGKNPGEHRKPMDVTVDKEDYVWVVDTQNRRVQKYTAYGLFLFETDNAGGTPFSEPMAAAVDSLNRVLVLDKKSGEITRLDENGNLVERFGGTGSGPGQFLHPGGLAVDGQDRIYVADTLNNRVQVLDSGGQFLLSFGSEGTSTGLFEHPTGVSVDPLTGNILVTDAMNDRVQVFGSSGKFIEQFGSNGSGNEQFRHPYETVTGRDHNLFASDMLNNRVTWEAFFGDSQNFVTQIPPTGYDLYKQPHGVAMNPEESILYTADTGNNRIVGLVIKTGVADTIMPRALITSPVSIATVTGILDIRGIAADAYFAQYRLEYGKGEAPETFLPIAISNEPVWNGSLGLWDTASLTTGTYTLRLTVTDKSGNVSQASCLIFVQANAPTLVAGLSVFPQTIVSGNGGAIISYRLTGKADVQLMVANRNTGQRVWMAGNGQSTEADVGEHTVNWDGRDERGQPIQTGTYTVLLAANDGTISQRKTADFAAIDTSGSLARGGLVRLSPPGLLREALRVLSPRLPSFRRPGSPALLPVVEALSPLRTTLRCHQVRRPPHRGRPVAPHQAPTTMGWVTGRTPRMSCAARIRANTTGTSKFRLIKPFQLGQ